MVLVAAGAGFLAPGVAGAAAGSAARLSAANRLADCAGAAEEPDYVALPAPKASVFYAACRSEQNDAALHRREEASFRCGLALRALSAAGPTAAAVCAAVKLAPSRVISVAMVAVGLTYVGPGAAEAAMIALTMEGGGGRVAVAASGAALAVTGAALAFVVIMTRAGALAAETFAISQPSISADSYLGRWRAMLAPRALLVEAMLSMVICAAAGADGGGAGSTWCVGRAVTAFAAAGLFAAFVLAWRPLAGPADADPWEHRFQAAGAVLTLAQCSLLVGLVISSPPAASAEHVEDVLDWLSAGLALLFGLAAVVLAARSLMALQGKQTDTPAAVLGAKGTATKPLLEAPTKPVSPGALPDVLQGPTKSASSSSTPVPPMLNPLHAPRLAPETHTA
jgi:hypothetical protein